ncbi:MAG: hypothetical protein ACYC10_20215 [Allorhizobium sp.]
MRGTIWLVVIAGALFVIFAALTAAYLFCGLSVSDLGSLGSLLSGFFALAAFLIAALSLVDASKVNEEQRKELVRQRRASERSERDRIVDLELAALHQACLAAYPNKTRLGVHTDSLVEGMPFTAREYFLRLCRSLREEAVMRNGEDSALARRVRNKPAFLAEVAKQLREVASHHDAVSDSYRLLLAKAKPNEVAELIEVAGRNDEQKNENR